MFLTRKIGFSFVFAPLFLSLSAVTALAQDDPPTRVLRLDYANGNVSAQPAGVDDWGPAPINRPFSVGDYLYTDQSSVAELVTDVARLRMAQFTNFGVLNLTDTMLQLKLTEGDMYFRVHDFAPDQVIEVDTPNAAVTLLRPGTYRVHVDPNQNTSFIVVRDGQLEITGGGQAFTLNPGNSAALAGTDQLSYDVEMAPEPDAFDNWCMGRDQRYERMAPRYVPPSMVGYEDLEVNGTWDEAPEYGHIWYPQAVAVGWAPYHYGHWAWIEPWGWTWVDDAPWGFAPFHYGRWVYYRDRWGWTPGPLVVAGPIVRPCYAPALVAWFGGAHFGVGLAFGGGAPSVGWVALGFGEVYTPTYHVSADYFRTVNVSNTRIVNTVNITNVYNTVYVNKTVYNTTYVNTRSPNAVMAMPQNSFASGTPVAQHAVVLQQQQIAQLRSGQASVVAPPVAPTRQATLNSLGRPAPHPPAQLLQRQVIARTTPPAPPASFQARQSYLQQHAGQPLNAAVMHQTVAPQQPQHPAVAVVHPAAARPQVVRPGAHAGNIPPAALNNRGPARPAAAGNAPAPSMHGVPPNQRRDVQSNQPPRQNETPAYNRPENRPAAGEPAYNQPRVTPNHTPAVQTQESSRPAPAPRTESRTEPRTEQPPAARTEPRTEPRREAPPPRNEQPAVRETAPSHTAAPQTHTAAPPARPAHEAPAKEKATKKEKDTKTDHK